LALLASPDGKGAGPNAKAIIAIKAALLRDVDEFPKERSRLVRETAIHALTMLSHGTGKVPVEFQKKALTDPAREVRLATLNAISSLKNEIDKKELPTW